MRIALPIWKNRISPVFDTARQLVLIDVEGRREMSRQLSPIDTFSPMRRVEAVRQLDIDLLVCGAITSHLLQGLQQQGVQVIPYVCGNVDDIVHGILWGDSITTRFAMAGRGRCWQHRGENRFDGYK